MGSSLTISKPNRFQFLIELDIVINNCERGKGVAKKPKLNIFMNTLKSILTLKLLIYIKKSEPFVQSCVGKKDSFYKSLKSF